MYVYVHIYIYIYIYIYVYIYILFPHYPQCHQYSIELLKEKRTLDTVIENGDDSGKTCLT
jgi:hypothetical protein